MRKIFILFLLILPLLFSCGWSMYKQESSFLRFPFVRLLEYRSRNQNPDEKSDFEIIQDNTQDGIIIIEHNGGDHNYLSLRSPVVSYWDGDNIWSFNEQGAPSAYVFPLEESDGFLVVTWDEGSGSNLIVPIQVVFTDPSDAVADVVPQTAHTIDYAVDFPTISAGGYDPQDPYLNDGRLYFCIPTDQEIYEVSYAVDPFGNISDPQVTRTSSLLFQDIINEYFSTGQDWQSYWGTNKLTVEKYFFYPDSLVSAFIMKREEYFSGEVQRYLITYDGTDLNGYYLAPQIREAAFLPEGYFFSESNYPDENGEYLELYDLSGNIVSSLYLGSENELKYISHGRSLNQRRLVFCYIDEDRDWGHKDSVTFYAFPFTEFLEAGK